MRPTTPVEPWRARALGPHAEVALVTASLVLIAAAGGDWSLLAVLAPSPLLVPVLWGALRGGVAAGLTAAALSGALHTLAALLVADLDLGALTERAVTWPLFVFAAVGYIVGHFRDLLVHRVRLLRSTRASLQAETARQRQDLDVLGHANHVLKRRIFDRSFDFDSLVATVARSAIDDDEHRFEAPLQMLAEFCGATKCSVLLVLQNGTLDLAAHRGWQDGEVGARLATANRSRRVRRAIAEARAIVTLADDEHDSDGPLLIAPIADGTGVIKVLVCIDDMLPQRFEESAVKTFLGIVSWLATNLRRVHLRDTHGPGRQHLLTAIAAKKHLGSVADLAERIHLEDARRRRYGVETEIVAIRMLDVRVNTVEYVEALESYLLEMLGATVRGTDDVFRFGFAGCYVLLLTGCKSGNGQTALSRLRQRFADLSDRDLGPVELRLFTTTTESPTLADLLGPLTDHFCGASPVPLAQHCPVPAPRPHRSGNAAELARRLRLETELARRLGTELSLIDFRRDDADGFGIGPMIARHLWNAAGSLLRTTDGIYVVGPGRCVVLLPFTSAVDAAKVWARLDDFLRGALPRDHYAGVRIDFLALDIDNLMQTVNYLAGPADKHDRKSALGSVTEIDLAEMDSPEEEAALDSAPTERGAAPARAELPDVPSTEAVMRRFDEVFGPSVVPPSGMRRPAPPAAATGEAKAGSSRAGQPLAGAVAQAQRTAQDLRARVAAPPAARPASPPPPVPAPAAAQPAPARAIAPAAAPPEKPRKRRYTPAELQTEIADVVLELARRHERFSTADVRRLAAKRGLPAPRSAGAWGLAMASAAKLGWIRKLGRRHGNPDAPVGWIGRARTLQALEPEPAAEVPAPEPGAVAPVAVAPEPAPLPAPIAPPAVPEASGDPIDNGEVVRILLEQIEGLLGLCIRLGGRSGEAVPRG